MKTRVEGAWAAADLRKATGAAAPGSAAPAPGCGCDDAGVLPISVGPPANGRPLGEGVEAAAAGGCCSGNNNRSEGMAALTVPLAPAAPHKRASFDQERPIAAHPAVHARGSTPGARAPAAGPPWLAAATAPGGALDSSLIGRDVARAVMTFVLTALSYALMLAAMSFHVAIFFAVCAGAGVGAGLFGRYRSNAAASHHEGCCG
jgi:hypothetical protein